MSARAPGRGQAGMTLVEMMIAMTVASMAIASSMAVAAMVSNQYKDSRDITQIERSARLSLELLSDSVRSAGPGVQSGLIGDSVGCSTMNAIRVTNNVTTGVVFNSATYGPLSPIPGSDVLEVIHASGGVYATARVDVLPGDTAVIVSDSAGFRVGDHALLVDLQGAGRFVRISGGALAATVIPITPPSTCGVPAAATFPAGSLIIRGRASRFFVTQLPGESFPSLMLDMDGDGPLEPEPVEPGIEDLQVAVGIDDDNDAQIDSLSAPPFDEWHGNAATDAPATPITGAAPWRALRVSLTARSLDGAGNPSIFNRPEVEDRAAGPMDPFRHRTLTTIIELRNLAGSQ